MHNERNIPSALYVVLTLVCVLLACSVLNGTAFASGTESNVQDVEENSETDVLPSEEQSGETDVENDSVSYSTEIVFEPMELDELGTASLSDVYNALVNIYNLGLMSFIVALMIWTYHMITKAFRRFIY